MSHTDVRDLLELLKQKEKIIQDNEFYYKNLLERFMWYIHREEGTQGLWCTHWGEYGFSVNEQLLLNHLWESAIRCPIICPEGARCTRDKNHGGPCAHKSCGDLK